MGSNRARFGPYTLIYPLGAGGMGEVFLAQQEGEHGIRRLLAVKRILQTISRDRRLVELFLDEVRIASQLNHGNIVQVIDHGTVEGRPYMAMEYVHGENLLQVLSRQIAGGRPMPVDFLLAVACGVCQGLDHAHTRTDSEGRPLGIVHRDISPQNILISFSGQIKVADFGVARAAMRTQETLGGELKGKLAYMSPEQARSGSVDARSDLYSLGLVLYEALTGVNPLKRETALETLDSVRDPRVPPLGQARPDLPPELLEVVHWTLEPDLDRRPDSARVLYEALQRTVRLYNLGLSPFDVGDAMQALFPEEQAARPVASDGGTQVGRRADGLGADLRETVFYLQKRHKLSTDSWPQPDLGTDENRPPSARRSSAGLDIRSAETADILPPSRRWPRILGLGVLGVLLAAGGTWLWTATISAPLAPPVLDGAVPSGTDRGPPRRGPDGAASNLRPGPDGSRPAPSRLAWLRIKGQPQGAWVELDDKRLPDRTPLDLRPGAGVHQVAVGLSGHRTWKGSVTLGAGERRVLDPTLSPLPALLTVRSSHPCRVSEGRQDLGPTPIVDRAMDEGPLTLRCVDPVAGVRAERRMILRPGERAVWELRFGALAINLDPWAQVTVDGVSRGTTPLRLLLSEGIHRVRLENTDRALSRELSVQIPASGTTRISTW